MEARLSRLEQQQPGEQTLGFSGGLRKLAAGNAAATARLTEEGRYPVGRSGR